MTRLPDWSAKLAATEEQLRHHTWLWGSHDCATVALDVVQAITGVLIEIPTTTPRERSKIAVTSFQEYVHGVVDRLNLTKTPAKKLHRGDPCWIKVDQRLALGFISSNGKPVVADNYGLTEATFDDILFGWSIPCRKYS